jgi:hypothetical protein
LRLTFDHPSRGLPEDTRSSLFGGEAEHGIKAQAVEMPSVEKRTKEK